MNCELCPRRCGADRTKKAGYCGENQTLRAALAGLHFWEEPCIAGSGGAGAVFFSGCSLKCVYCQNKAVSCGGRGKEITVLRLREIFDELICAGADVIDLVTPTHFLPQVAEALAAEKLPVPVVYNCGGYEDPLQLRRLEGLVDIYLPDFKYADAFLAKRLSNAEDYPQVALSAIKEMYRQTGDYVLDEDGMLASGVLVRHLVLSGFTDNTLDCVDLLTRTFTDKNILFSLMSQYTPPKEPLEIESLNRRLTQAEYDRCVDYLYLCGWENGYVQELSSAKEEYTPDFNFEGL